MLDVMPPRKTKKKRKTTKYKVISIKITSKQKKSLKNFCLSRHTTPNKIIKKAIGAYLNNYAGLEVKTRKEKASQLELFSLE